jgi:hypothetical protein
MRIKPKRFFKLIIVKSFDLHFFTDRVRGCFFTRLLYRLFNSAKSLKYFIRFWRWIWILKIFWLWFVYFYIYLKFHHLKLNWASLSFKTSKQSKLIIFSRKTNCQIDQKVVQKSHLKRQWKISDEDLTRSSLCLLWEMSHWNFNGHYVQAYIRSI